jgi:F0F1-type ATP synthase membrane subunit b/b'
MNEKRIQQILDFEKQALAVHEAAVKEAEQLPRRAEQEVQALLEQGRTEAEAEAHRMVAQAQAEAECAHILEQSEERLQRAEKLARLNFERAVNYTLARVLGTELR